GQDVLSHYYDQPPSYFNSNPDQFKEYFFRENLPKYIEAGIPIWGTCLGMQMISLYFGAEIHQHIDVESHGYSSKHPGELVHKLHFTPKYIGLKNKIVGSLKGAKLDEAISVCSR